MGGWQGNSEDLATVTAVEGEEPKVCCVEDVWILASFAGGAGVVTSTFETVTCSWSTRASMCLRSSCKLAGRN